MMMANPILDKITSLNREIEQLRAENDHLRRVGPIYEALTREVYNLRAENERLRARVASLERVRAAAQALIDYEHEGPDASGMLFWMKWEGKFQAMRGALKEATP